MDAGVWLPPGRCCPRSALEGRRHPFACRFPAATPPSAAQDDEKKLAHVYGLRMGQEIDGALVGPDETFKGYVCVLSLEGGHTCECRAVGAPDLPQQLRHAPPPALPPPTAQLPHLWR